MTHIHRSPIRQDYESLAVYILEGFQAHRHNPKSLRWFVAGIRNQIFDLAEIYTGYRSQESIGQDQYTPEHIYPRQKSAEFIVNTLLSGRKLSVKRLTMLLMPRARVNHVTSVENKRLVNMQKSDSYRWRKAYQEIGIVLMRDGSTRRKNKRRSFIVDGVLYEMYRDVIDHIPGLDYSTLYARCKSPSKKWSTWSFVEV